MNARIPSQSLPQQALTTVFVSGNSQAVRLPKEFRFTTKQVTIERRGDEIVLREKNARWVKRCATPSPTYRHCRQKNRLNWKRRLQPSRIKAHWRRGRCGLMQIFGATPRPRNCQARRRRRNPRGRSRGKTAGKNELLA